MFFWKRKDIREKLVINYLRKATRGKDRILNEAVTIDEQVEKNIKYDFDTEFSFMIREREEMMSKEIEKKLTEFENKVFKFKVEGYSFEEIANILDRDIKSIYNTFQRIKNKIKKIIKNDDYL